MWLSSPTGWPLRASSKLRENLHNQPGIGDSNPASGGWLIFSELGGSCNELFYGAVAVAAGVRFLDPVPVIGALAGFAAAALAARSRSR